MPAIKFNLAIEFPIRLCLIAFVLLLAACASLRPEGPSCEISKPPKTSGVNFVHASPIYVFPRSPSADFTGCQVVWDANGRKVMWAKFRNGGVFEYAEFAESADVKVLCLYEKDKLVPPSHSSCPERASIQSGFRSLTVEEEQHLPPFRDLRKLE